MKKGIVTLLIVAFFAVKGNAQALDYNYTSAIGVKFYPGAITFKTFTSDTKAVEALGYFWDYGMRVTGLYEIHGDINVDGLRWYVGPGAHLGFFNNKWKTDYPGRESGVALGIDGVLGLDYKFFNAPINISADWQPSFNFVGYNYFEGGWGGISVRYTF